MINRWSILIVEDNSTKRAEIEKAINLPPLRLEIDGASSIASAYRALDKKMWDLIILDMTFQISLNGGGAVASGPLAGIELLQFISKKRNRSPVIVATQHSSFTSPSLPGIDSIEKLDELLRELFPEHYRGTVLVDLAADAWKARLQSMVGEVLNARA